MAHGRSIYPGRQSEEPNMKKMFILAASFYVTCACAAAPIAPDARPQSKPTAPMFPLQLEMRAPFDPTAFPSAGRTYLTYELYLTNFSGSPMTLRRIEVLDTGQAPTKPIAAFEGEQIDSRLQTIGARASTDDSNPRQLSAGATVIVFMWIPFDTGTQIPNRLGHRILTADSSVESAVIGSHHTELQVLGPPVQGPGWLASDGPSNDRDNHHRRGFLLMDGHPIISRRYAIDWKRMENGAAFAGNERENRSYYSYGEPVLAVASGTIVTARDGLPDNNPGHFEAFRPAVPITLETIAGNTITLDLGGGQFAYYFHLQPGSVRVQAGDHVRRGEVLGRIGCSGDAREPHLHFEVTTSPRPLVGEGVPYLIDSYRMKGAGDASQTRTRELPLRDMLIDFAQTGEDTH